MSDNDQMKLFVDNLWRYFEPKIEEKMRSSIRYYRAEVTANPGGNRLTVQRPFDTPVTIPCVDCMSDAKAGDQVLVMVFGGSANGSNSVVVGDGALHAFGGVNSPLSISNGGTGANTADGVRTSLLDLGYINGDLDHMTSIGASWCDFSYCTNAPFSSGYGYVIRDCASGSATQTAFRYDIGMIYRRSHVNGSWTAWRNSFDVGTVTATTYPPEAGIYVVTGDKIFQNMTPYSLQGVLLIFKAGYSAHIYIDSYFNLYYGFSGNTFAEPSKWYTPSVTQKT